MKDILHSASSALDHAGQAEGITPEGPGRLAIIRRNGPSALEGMIYEPLICLVLQGAKAVTSGQSAVTVEGGQLLVVSHDIPVLSRIVRATPEHPYVAIVVPLDLAQLRALSGEAAAPVRSDPAALQSTPCPAPLADACHRLLALRGQPEDARVLAPLIVRELHYRLLTGPTGPRMAALLREGSPEGRIAAAIATIRRAFDRPLDLSALARDAGMSRSTFHAHFRAVTATSPLQYQKDLRLLHARDRLQSDRRSVTEVALDVGYQSATQFSRDYSRRFGQPPRNDRANAANQSA